MILRIKNYILCMVINRVFHEKNMSIKGSVSVSLLHLQCWKLHSLYTVKMDELFLMKIFMADDYESYWCVIGDKPVSSHKNIS